MPKSCITSECTNSKQRKEIAVVILLSSIGTVTARYNSEAVLATL